MAKKKEQKTGGTKQPVGRPSKYEPEFIEKVDQYIQRSLKKGDQKELPTMEGLAIYLGVVVNTLKNWSKENPEFLTALRRLRDYQKRELINRGLLGTYNPTITKLILSSNHGMKERLDQTSGDEPVSKRLAKPLTIEEMKKRIRAYEKAGTGIDYRSIEGSNREVKKPIAEVENVETGLDVRSIEEAEILQT